MTTKTYYQVQTECGVTFTDGTGEYNHAGFKKCQDRIAELRSINVNEQYNYWRHLVLKIVRITVTTTAKDVYVSKCDND